MKKTNSDTATSVRRTSGARKGPAIENFKVVHPPKGKASSEKEQAGVNYGFVILSGAADFEGFNLPQRLLGESYVPIVRGGVHVVGYRGQLIGKTQFSGGGNPLAYDMGLPYPISGIMNEELDSSGENTNHYFPASLLPVLPHGTVYGITGLVDDYKSVASLINCSLHELEDTDTTEYSYENSDAPPDLPSWPSSLSTKPYKLK